MAKSMSRGLVATSAAAIAAVYLAGYLTTQPVAARLSQAAASAQAVQTGALAGAPTGTTAPPFTLQRAPAISAANAPASSAAYHDGTWQGSGDSRRGGFDVAVTIQNGRINNVAITNAWTEYPASRVAALPGEVVARQSAQVDRVTGATYSTLAFQQAIQQALAQAQSGVAAPATSVTTQPSQPLAQRRSRRYQRGND